MNTKGTVYLLDDEPKLVKALERLLTGEGFSVHGYTSVKTFFDAARTGEPSCLVLDVGMPELNGLDLQQRLAHEGILIPIVFLTGRGDIPMSVQAIKAGAVDFLTKPVLAVDLLRAVNAALAHAAEQRAFIGKIASLRQRYANLTPREREVMQYVVAGQLNKQIAAVLEVGEHTIKIHRGRLMAKMEMTSVADLVRAAEHLNGGK